MQPLTSALAAKIGEQIERTIHLIALVPDTEWRPPIRGAWKFGELLDHLSDCLAGVCAVLYAAHPEELSHFIALRELPAQQIEIYRTHIEQGFAVLNDADLSRKLPTVFVPEGETVLTLLLGNLEHLINHKHQLFTYLKLASVDVGTPDLYRFRE